MNFSYDLTNALVKFHKDTNAIPQQKDLLKISEELYDRYKSFYPLSEVIASVDNYVGVLRLQSAFVMEKIVEVNDAALDKYSISNPGEVGEGVEGEDDDSWTPADIPTDLNVPVEVKGHLDISEVARIAHEVNQAYCAAIGDTPIPDWDDAPDAQRNGMINGVLYNLNNPDAKPDANHNNWLKVKQADGWQYGPVKDEDKKEHPCYMPYNELPKEQRLKDALFQGTVRSLLKFVKLAHTPAAE